MVSAEPSLASARRGTTPRAPRTRAATTRRERTAASQPLAHLGLQVALQGHRIVVLGIARSIEQRHPPVTGEGEQVVDQLRLAVELGCVGDAELLPRPLAVVE